MTDRDRLAVILREIGPMAIAVSGGVDSVTLAEFAHRTVGAVRMVHATSAAVPGLATARLQAHAERSGWPLRVVNAGEFSDMDYVKNPVNRCYFCKNNLYSTLAKIEAGVICSGANLDDLSDYRPGLIAAEERKVRHPFVEAGFAKAQVRALARALELADFADLPASPCLASRVETGIAIDARELILIDRVEAWLRRKTDASTIRCRLRPGGFEFQFDGAFLDRFSTADRKRLGEAACRAHPELGSRPPEIREYLRGSAFVTDRTERK